jgi:hypothetical protein
MTKNKIYIFELKSFLEKNKISIPEKSIKNYFIITYESLFVSYDDLFDLNKNPNESNQNQVCIINNNYMDIKNKTDLIDNLTYVKKLIRENYKCILYNGKINIDNYNFKEIIDKSNIFVLLNNNFMNEEKNILFYYLGLKKKYIIHNDINIKNIFKNDIFIYINDNNMIIKNIDKLIDNNKTNVNNQQYKFVDEMNYVKKWNIIFNNNNKEKIN